jgi:hypothetical protein
MVWWLELCFCAVCIVCSGQGRFSDTFHLPCGCEEWASNFGGCYAKQVPVLRDVPAVDAYSRTCCGAACLRQWHHIQLKPHTRLCCSVHTLLALLLQKGLSIHCTPRHNTFVVGGGRTAYCSLLVCTTEQCWLVGCLNIVADGFTSCAHPQTLDTAVALQSRERRYIIWTKRRNVLGM